MATSQVSAIIHHLRRTVLPRGGADLTDGQLLEDYINRRDEAALAALVRRHAAMVWGVCRRVLRNYHDAEDAFQATFLVLVRKAASIASRELLANWLYGVAHWTALKARATAAKRCAKERQLTQMPEPAVAEQDLWRDLQPVLDQELSRLPDKYRGVIVLCGLEGKTRKEAARQLGVPEGTVASRLATARTMLAKRLAQRGVALPDGALAAVLSQKVASAGVPASVVSATVKAASLLAAGQAAATAAISAKVAVLTEGVLKAMFLTKLKSVSVVFLVVATLSGAAGAIYRTQAAEQPKAQTVTKQADANKSPAANLPAAMTDMDRRAATEKSDPLSAAEIRLLQGIWDLQSIEVDAGGRLQKGTVAGGLQWIIAGEKCDAYQQGRCLARRTFVIDPKKNPKEMDLRENKDGKTIVRKAIYQLEGDVLTVCVQEESDERPEAFEGRGSCSLRVWKRQIKARHEKPGGKSDKEKPAADDGGKQTADAGFDRLLLNSAKDEVERAEEELRLAESSYFSLAHGDFFKKAAAERMERARANLKLAQTNLKLAQEAQTKQQPAEKTSPEKMKS